MGIRRQILVRSYVFYLLILISLITILWKVFDIQNIQSDTLYHKYQETYIKEKTIETERGTIFDENGEVISYSIPKYDVYVDFGAEGLRKRKEKYIKLQLDTLSKCLATIFPKQKYEEFKNTLFNAYDSKKRVLVLLKRISYQDKIKLETLPLIKEKNKYRTGFIFYPIISRFYPYGMMARRAIGYYKKNSTLQLTGIENYYDKYLRGEEVKIPMRRISGGYYAPIENEDIEINRGADIVSTLDMYTQELAHNALLKVLKKNEAEYGTCIIMDVKTGKIKTWVNLGKQGKNDYYENYNYGMMKYQPGSTFKLLTLMALLEEGYTPSDSVRYYNGKKSYFGNMIRDHAILPTQNITLEKSFIKSSNIGMIEFTLQEFQNRKDKFSKYISQAILDKKTGIDLNGEATPYIKTPNNAYGIWEDITLPSMAMGYELELTPLQILRFYNAIANDGVMMKPYLVNQIVKEGKVVLKNKPEIIRSKICSRNTLRHMRQLLEKVVTEGTGKYIFSNTGYKSAGKTGTAMFAADKDGYIKDVYISSFAGYFPAENPKYSCIVVIKNKQNATYHTGASTAAPVFKEIADKLIVNKVIQQHNKEHKIHIVTKNYSNKLKNYLLEHTPPKVMDIARHKSGNDIPDLRGLPLRKAMLILENRGIFHVQVDGIGKVVAQSNWDDEQLNQKKVVLKLQ